MNSGALVIRSDANAHIGTGHVMRCLALAQAWQVKAGRAIFVSAELPPALESRLALEGFSVTRVPAAAGTVADAEFTIEVARNQGAQWVVIDGEHFDACFLQSVRSASRRVLLIDDFARREQFPADLILNPNLGAREESYRRRGVGGALCLGESYVLLRDEFTASRGSRVFSEKGNRVLVTLGGSDPDALTLKIVETLTDMPECEITAVVGPACTNWSELRRLASGRVQVLWNPLNMRELMERSDIAVIAAGGTLWELLYMECAILSYARNPLQTYVIEDLDRRGALRNLGATLDFDEGTLAVAACEMAQSKMLRQRMANIGRRIIDGRGKDRILQAMGELGGCG